MPNDNVVQDQVYRELFKSGFTKGEQRKAKIVEATIESIAKAGISHTTFDSIAKIARMNRAHIAYYFPTRDAMVLAAIKLVVMTAQQITIQQIRDAKNPLERLKAMID